LEELSGGRPVTREGQGELTSVNGGGGESRRWLSSEKGVEIVEFSNGQDVGVVANEGKRMEWKINEIT
jgi:hypothetical protein